MNARALSLIPLTSYAVIVGFAIYAALVVGHWPHYANPDPKSLPLTFLTNAVALVMLIGATSVVFLPIIYAAYRAVARWKNWKPSNATAPFLFYSVGAALWLVDFTLIYTSNYSLIVWLID